MPVIEVNNTPVHYQELNRGAAETVVLVHGMMSNLSVFYFNIAPVLATRYHVVMYDLKGHGLSGKATTGYHLKAMAADLIALLDALHLQQVHLAGYSFGALIALQTAMLCPHRVQQLAVIEAPDPSDQHTLSNIASYSKSTLLELIAASSEAQGKPMSKRQLERNYSMYEFLLQQTSLKADMYGEKEFMLQQSLQHITHPTLLLYGTDSDCRRAGTHLQQHISQSELHWISGNHHIPVQQPELVATRLSQFLQQHHTAPIHFQPSQVQYQPQLRM